MAGFWANYKRKYITEPILRKNGYYELSENVRKKVDYFNNDHSSKKYNDYFNWDEYYEFVIKTTYLHLFRYKNIEFGLEIHKKQSFFYTEDTQSQKSYSEKYRTPKELLENARVDGKSLKEIWEDLEIR